MRSRPKDSESSLLKFSRGLNRLAVAVVTSEVVQKVAENLEKLSTIGELARSGKMIPMFALSFAEAYLERRGHRGIWREITPKNVGGFIKCDSSPVIIKKLGQRPDSTDTKWADWDAAELAACASLALSSEDQELIKALYFRIGTLAPRKMTRTLMQDVAQRPRPNARGKIRSPLKKLVLRMRESQKNLTPQIVIDEFKQSVTGPATPRLMAALNKNPTLNIKIQEVLDGEKWPQGQVFFIDNDSEKEGSVQFKMIRDWLPGPKHRKRQI